VIVAGVMGMYFKRYDLLSACWIQGVTATSPAPDARPLPLASFGLALQPLVMNDVPVLEPPPLGSFAPPAPYGHEPYATGKRKPKISCRRVTDPGDRRCSSASGGWTRLFVDRFDRRTVRMPCGPRDEARPIQR
jgi:hypothetical protein